MNSLLIDADDTLWENNVYFEEVREEFLGFMQILGFEAAQVDSVRSEVERRNIELNGYGSENFIQSLNDTMVSMTGSIPGLSKRLKQIDGMAEVIRSHPIQLIAGVQEVLPLLVQRYCAIMFTKGSVREQSRKVQESGLVDCFKAIEIVGEKNTDSFEAVIKKYQLDKAKTSMIGNSPRSDINPAVAAGISAYYIPHARTWERENETLCSSIKITVLRGFAELLTYL
jgi:putative hydrolase of the HAD superfamily